MTDTLTIAVDFDGTLVAHEYPATGETNPGGIEVLQALAHVGHRIILLTMRDNVNKIPKWPEGCEVVPTVIEAAIEWCEEHNIPIFAVNRNPRCTFSKSPKVYANIYIDDAALGCPLVFRMDKRGYTYGHPMVDWFAVEGMLIRMGVLPKRTLPEDFYAKNKLIPVDR